MPCHIHVLTRASTTNHIALDTVEKNTSAAMGSGSEGNPAPPRLQDDFYRHVNAEWLAANPVPPEYSRWGTFEKLNDEALAKTRTTMEEVGPEDKAGAWMVSGMNAANQNSHEALAPTLAIAKQLSEASVRTTPVTRSRRVRSLN